MVHSRSRLRMSKKYGKTALDRLIRKATRRDRRAISQLMSMAENDAHSRLKILAKLYWRGKGSHVIGITGSPGCGKSTLIAQLAKHYRDAGHSVGVVAVDPSSQITGGALLGDRIRMSELAADPKVFIRSMATRGAYGGLARATEDAVRILAATSTERLIVETAGTGQSDVDVKALADTTVVVTSPGLGDEIQALKAGIMEIGDIFVVNKADKENADQTAREIDAMISMGEWVDGWRPRVIKTIATTGEGVVALSEAIRQHSEHIRNASLVRADLEKVRREVLGAAQRYFEDVKLQEIASSAKFKRVIVRVGSRRMDPYTAARVLVEGS
jgi:LAO/AO transport system kinase